MRSSATKPTVQRSRRRVWRNSRIGPEAPRCGGACGREAGQLLEASVGKPGSEHDQQRPRCGQRGEADEEPTPDGHGPRSSTVTLSWARQAQVTSARLASALAARVARTIPDDDASVDDAPTLRAGDLHLEAPESGPVLRPAPQGPTVRRAPLPPFALPLPARHRLDAADARTLLRVVGQPDEPCLHGAVTAAPNTLSASEGQRSRHQPQSLPCRPVSTRERRWAAP